MAKLLAKYNIRLYVIDRTIGLMLLQSCYIKSDSGQYLLLVKVNNERMGHIAFNDLCPKYKEKYFLVINRKHAIQLFDNSIRVPFFCEPVGLVRVFFINCST